MSNTYKIVFAGPGGVGKTSLVHRLTIGEFKPNYWATIGVEVHSFTQKDNKDDDVSNTFNIWDCAGREKFCGLSDGYFIGADAAVVLYDVSSMFSYLESKDWIVKIRRVCNDIPIFLIGNKVELNHKAPETSYMMSVKDNTFTIAGEQRQMSDLFTLLSSAILNQEKGNADKECKLAKKENILKEKELILTELEAKLSLEQKSEYYKFCGQKLRELLCIN